MIRQNKKYYGKLVTILVTNAELLDYLRTIAKLQVETPNPSNFIIATTPSVQSSFVKEFGMVKSKINDFLAENIEKVKELRPNKLFRNLAKLKSDLASLDEYYEKSTLFVFLDILAESHTDAYSNRDIRSLNKFVNDSFIVMTLIDSIKSEASRKMFDSSRSQIKIPENYVRLEISSDQETSRLDDLKIIIDTIHGLYNFICTVYQIDYKTSPLIIDHVETGSWLVELFGIKQVVKSMENLLTSAGGFFRDFITGKISRERFENDCAKMKAFIDVVAYAEEKGLKNSDLGLKKPLNALAESLNQNNATTLEVNDNEVLDLGSKARSKQLVKRDEPLWLEERNDNNSGHESSFV